MSSDRHLVYAVVLFIPETGRWVLFRKYSSLLAAKNEAIGGRAAKRYPKTAVVDVRTQAVLWPVEPPRA